MPSSRETIAAWQVIPPESVTIAASPPHQRHPVGGRHVGDQDLALAEALRVGELADDANVAAAGAGRGAEAADEHLTSCSMPSAARAAGGGHRPRLQHPRVPSASKAPFGVLGDAVVRSIRRPSSATSRTSSSV